MKTWGVIGCGWLGLPFAKDLIGQNHKVFGTTSTKEKIKILKKEGIYPVHLRTEDFANQHSWLKECDRVLLNIPPSGFGDKYPEAMSRILQNINSDTKVIFIGSTSVYGDNNQVAKEEDKLDGTNRNAPALIETEQKLIQQLGKDLTIIRMAGLIGKDRNPAKYMVGKHFKGGSEPVNLIHLEDAKGIISKVEENNFWGETLNGCCEDHPKKSDFYTWVAKKNGVTPPTFENQQTSYKSVSNEKSRNELGYNYKFSSPYDFPVDI